MRWVKPPYGSGRECSEYEADQRHFELIFHQLGLSNSSRSVSTPSEKSQHGVDLSSLLNSADHTLYRSATMNLASDRPICKFHQKNWRAGCKHRQLDTWRVARYLIGHGRLLQEFVRQIEESSHVVVFTDSDHAGCLKTS